MTPPLASNIGHDIWVGGNKSRTEHKAIAVNVCWTAERDGETNVPFGDSYLSGSNWLAAVHAFKIAMNLRYYHPQMLIRCQKGLNRSTLIAGGILIAEGVPP